MSFRRRGRRYRLDRSLPDDEASYSASTNRPQPYAGITPESWAMTVLLASLRRLEAEVNNMGVGQLVEVLEIRASSTDSLAIIFRATWFNGPVGLYLDTQTRLSEEDYTSVESPGRPIGSSSPEQLSFDIAHLMIGEPFGEEAVTGPDDRGIRWLLL